MTSSKVSIAIIQLFGKKTYANISKAQPEEKIKHLIVEPYQLCGDKIINMTRKELEEFIEGLLNA